jgi:prophage regulatory protein
MQFLRVRKVTEMVGFSKTTLYARVKDGSFPKPIRLGPNSVAFLEADILDWMQSQIAQLDSPGATRGARAIHAAKVATSRRNQTGGAT